jgi:small subunit ribosomal protein S20
VRTHFKRLESAVGEGDAETADAEHRELCAKIDTAVAKGALHRNAGARKKARAARLRAGSSA